jgi:hypothetical protein
MNKSNIPEPDLDNLLKRTLKDDLPPEAEARMNRQFLRLRHTLDRPESLAQADGRRWMTKSLQKDVLAVASAAMLILGMVMQLSGSQTVLAHSIEQLKVMVTISMGLSCTSSMDCTVRIPGAEEDQISYRVRWRAMGDVRVDMDGADGVQTLWISNETVSVTGPGIGNLSSMCINMMTPGPVWQPALEFMSPEIVAKHIEEQYGLMQSVGRVGAGTNEFLIIGREGWQDVEITIDAKTYLPKVLKKYSHDSDRTKGTRNCAMEARFLWNQPILGEIFIPQIAAAER